MAILIDPGIEMRGKGGVVKIVISDNAEQMGGQAAVHAAQRIREALDKRGKATIIVATGASQFSVLEQLVKEPGIDWSRVTGFHLDEYIGLPITHPASFRLYIWQRLLSRLPVPMAAFHFVDGSSDQPDEVCATLSARIRDEQVDVALVGIGENGHLAFNDPPADFETDAPYRVVRLDEACRRQQMGEGWFPDLISVPETAITMSIRQIMKSRALVCSVPDRRKAEAVRDALEGPVTPACPASILQQHPEVTIYLDKESASLLKASA
jgi:glucosamine-6-phosphate deaminase